MAHIIHSSDGGSLADAIVAKLCHVTRTRSLEHAIEIGQIVVQGVYEGRLEALQGQGEAHPLYKHIASHGQLPFGPKRLWMCVKIYELTRTFPGLRESPHLGIAHLRAVLTLPSHVQERLLRDAEQERWTSQQIEYKAGSFRRSPPNTGRPPTRAFLRGIERIEELAQDIQKNIAPRVRGRLTTARLILVKKNIQRTRRLLESLEEQLEGEEHGPPHQFPQMVGSDADKSLGVSGT